MIQLYNIDCMTYMSTCTDKQFDLAIVDPPYGVNLSGGRGSNGWSDKSFWDKARDGWNTKIPDTNYFTELRRISVHQIIWGGNYFELPPSQCWLIWDKGQRDFSLADGEMAWTNFDKAVRIYELSRAAANQEDKIHPTQKPVQLYKWLLKNFATTDMTIIDTHLGSGSSAIAAHDFGCDFVGCEIDKDYFEAAKKRFDIHTMQKKLF